MNDPLTWSPINLGRWAGTQVRIHVALIVFVFFRLFHAAVVEKQHPIATTACWIALLLVALVLHELGHASMAAWLGADRDEVRLWPLGNMVSPSASSRAPDHALVALAGPAVNLTVALIAAIGLNAFSRFHFVWSPFGNGLDVVRAGSGAPFLATGKADAPFAAASPFTWVWYAGWFGYLSWVIFLANLIPSLPFDMGRVVRSGFSASSAVPSKDGMLAPWTARAFAIILAAGGVVRLIFFARGGDGYGLILIALALLIEWMVRSETRMMEDGGFYDDGVFGYDFSEGYTSLEGSAAKVRPYRESALRRWRRRRSELRRRRRAAREAAEERRIDEILDKIYREGKASLSEEEQGFLVRVSHKYRNKPKAHE